tara:strand:+ start:849 stop:1010 length:162 start_codon:yes stop_codon:yes gene_type:complete
MYLKSLSEELSIDMDYTLIHYNNSQLKVVYQISLSGEAEETSLSPIVENKEIQ